MKRYLITFLSILCFFSLATSCKKKDKTPIPKATDGSYFSIRRYAMDQFHVYWGQPFSIDKIVTLNGKTDSTIENAYSVNWGNILKPFFESDISDLKFVGHYTFSSFEDDANSSLTYYYEAKDKNLFTKSLQIVTDPFTHKVKSIYVETAKNSRFSEKSQKLLYVPLKMIQIQEFESSFLSKNKNLRIEYRF